MDEWTFGFESLRERASEYTPEKASEITWIPAEKIRESARPTLLTPGHTPSRSGGRPDRAQLHSGEQARLCLRALRETFQ